MCPSLYPQLHTKKNPPILTRLSTRPICSTVHRIFWRELKPLLSLLQVYLIFSFSEFIMEASFTKVKGGALVLKVRLNGMGSWDTMKWDGMGSWDGTRYEGVGWDGIQCDHGIQWNRLKWDTMERDWIWGNGMRYNSKKMGNDELGWDVTFGFMFYYLLCSGRKEEET